MEQFAKFLKSDHLPQEKRNIEKNIYAFPSFFFIAVLFLKKNELILNNQFLSLHFLRVF